MGIKIMKGFGVFASMDAWSDRSSGEMLGEGVVFRKSD